MKATYIFLVISLLSISKLATAITYTWTGSADTVFTNKHNWSQPPFSPSTYPGYPTSGDTAIIVTSAANRPTLSSDRDVYRLVITSGNFDLKGFTFTSTGSGLFSGGIIENGALDLRGTKAEFTGTTFNVTVDVFADKIALSGGIFNEICIFTTTGEADSEGMGGCVFNEDVQFIHTGINGKVLLIAKQTGDQFNGNVIFINNSNSQIRIADRDSTYFNGNIELNNMNTGLIYFGYKDGYIELATGKTISVGDSGFFSGELYLNNFTQNGNTSQSLVLTDSSKVYIQKGCVFEGNLTLTAPDILCGSSTFNGTTQITKTRTSGNYWSGDNIFNGVTTITYQGTGGGAGDELRLASTDKNIYNNDVAFESSGNPLQVLIYNGSEFHNNVSTNNAAIFFRKGLAQFKGTNAQALNGSVTYDFDEVIIDKTAEQLTLNTSLNIHESVQFNKGNIISDTINFITFQPNSKAIGAHNGSFVSGPVKKVGDTEFEFPVGKGEDLTPIKISAPTLDTDAFIAEYFDSIQMYGATLDTTLDGISNCDYWTLERVSGGSNVKVTLKWTNQSCNPVDIIDNRLVSFYGGKWNNGGADGTISNGFNEITSDSSQSTFTAFTVGFVQGGNSCPSTFNLTTVQLCNDSIFQTINHNVWYTFTSDSLSLLSTFYNMNADSGEYFIENIEMYQGTCSSLRYVGGNNSNIFRDSISFVSDGLDTLYSSQYFIRISKADSCYSCIPDTLKFKFCILPQPQVISPFMAYENLCGLNYTVGTVQLNQRVSPGANPQTGSTFPANIPIVASGVQTQIIGAFLYLTCVGSAPPNVSLAAISNGTNSSGINLVLIDQENPAPNGNGGTCWASINPNFDHTFTYRADILPFVNNAATNYIIDGLPVSNQVDWDGASIIIIYRDCQNNPREASLYLLDGLQVMSGFQNYTTTINFLPNASNTYQNDQGFINVTDVETANATFFRYLPGFNPPTVAFTNNNGNAVPNNFYSVNIQNSGTVNGTIGNSSSFCISSTTSDCFTVPFAGLFFEEGSGGVVCQNCSCDENDLYCAQNITVTTSVEWTPGSYPGTGCPGGVLTMNGDLVIQPGVSLTLNGVQIRFGPDSRIIVKRGTTSIPDGAVLTITNGTVLTANNNTCMWQGIHVWGYRNQPANAPGQAGITMNNSFLSFAHEGILFGRRDGGTYLATHTGGAIKGLTGNTFTDNNTSIRFPLSFFSQRSFQISTNTFECLMPLRDGVYNQERSQYFIDVNNNPSIPFNASTYFGIYNNTFINMPINWQNRTIGIRAYMAGNLPIMENNFTNLDNGILFSGNGINNRVDFGNLFTLVNRGIWNRNNRWNRLNRSSFAAGSGVGSAGIINQRAFATRIQLNFGNQFRDGIQLINSSSTIGDVEVWENTTINILRPLLAGGNNFLSTWYCNIVDDYNPSAWRIYDIGGVANVQNQGLSSIYSPANQFLKVSPDPTLDIVNSTISSFSLNYFVESVNVGLAEDPDVVSTNVNVFYNGGTSICSSLRSEDREIADILAQRDTSYGDSLLLANLNSDIMRYYLDKMEHDSLLNYFDTLAVSTSDRYTIQLYCHLNKIDSVRAILNRWPNNSQDDQDLIDFYTLYCDMNEDTLSFYDMDGEQKMTLETLAEQDNEAGELAKDVLNVIEGIPLELTCEQRADCEEERKSKPIDKVITFNEFDNVFIYPNPGSELISIKSNYLSKKSYIVIYNHLNQIVFSRRALNDNYLELNVNFLKNGVYYVCIKTKNKCSAFGKLVVLH